MQVLIENNTVVSFPYSFDQLRQDNPGISFPISPSNDVLNAWGIYEVKQIPPPDYNYLLQKAEQLNPILVDGVWTQLWVIVDLTAEESTEIEAQRQAQLENQRAEAYRVESDPIFFKAQRGEATQQEWLDKVAEIKARYQ